MKDPAEAEPSSLRVGGLSRPELKTALGSAGVHLNASAVTLLDDAVFDVTEPETIEIVARSVAGVGLSGGAPLSRILAVARERGLMPCPPTTGPYLRLARADQAVAPDSVMSNGRAPAGAVTVASVSLSADDDYPKGFYLRVVDGRAWLRGYRCTDAHTWLPEDRFVFRLIDRA